MHVNCLVMCAVCILQTPIYHAYVYCAYKSLIILAKLEYGAQNNFYSVPIVTKLYPT